MQSAIFLCSVVGNGPSPPKYQRCSMYLLHLINSVKFDFHTANIWKSFGISKYFLFGYSNSFVFSFIYKNRAKLKNIPPLFLTNVVKRFELTKFYCFSQQVYSSLYILSYKWILWKYSGIELWIRNKRWRKYWVIE